MDGSERSGPEQKVRKWAVIEKLDGQKDVYENKRPQKQKSCSLGVKGPPTIVMNRPLDTNGCRWTQGQSKDRPLWT